MGMKAFHVLIALCAWGLVFPAVAVAVAGVEGVWRVEGGDAHIEVVACGDQLCGSIVWLAEPHLASGEPKTDYKNPDPSLRDRPILGLELVRGFSREPNSKGVWTGGTIYDAESGKTFKAQMQLDGDNALKLRGYVGISLIGRTTRWTRVEGTLAAGGGG